MLAFYDLMFNQCRPAEAVDKYVGVSYTKHKPRIADGKVGFVAYFERMAWGTPANGCGSSGSSPRATKSCCAATRWPGGPDWAGIDIFRLDADDKVVEHWDELQTVTEQAANGNGMF